VWGATAREVERIGLRGDDAPLPLASDYAFLVGRHIDRATLVRAEALGEKWGVLPHTVMIANGWLSAHDYYRALAEACGVPYRDDIPLDAVTAPLPLTNPRQCILRGLLKERGRRSAYVIAPDELPPTAVARMLRDLRPYRVSLAAPHDMRRAIFGHFARAFADVSVDGLRARDPAQSARSNLAPWQLAVLACSLVAFAAAVTLQPLASMRAVSYALAFISLPLIALRVFAACDLLSGRQTQCPSPRGRIDDAELPVYTILVPLFREANVLAPLMRAVARLDYPAAKLDIKLILEAVDGETIAAAQALDLPGSVEIVVVPELFPRTKPKALNYALPLARGDYLVIYDAEDRPEPDQLRKAVAAFREGPPNLACVQARLNLYNAFDTWLTRQFAIEYGALFDGILPALDRLALPIPLGGTSNHFRVPALKWLMAWDPFNVTEDADLGTRLARKGYRCRVLASTTFEEAPTRFMSWLRQRSRWMKGYMQTWLVHMRSPRALWRELGPSGFLAFHVMVGGTLLSALVHPWFYALATYDLAHSAFLAQPVSLFGLPFWLIASFSLATGYFASMALGLFTLRLRGSYRLIAQVPLMPLYWLLISAAAYRALWQFATKRFAWEKTEHGLARSMAPPR
jgi:cellulose synthase/poly-beta-1,6-N-acetylglucosamine synthase-like glycosyltransferase